jgi:peptidoglycan/LPS O-acetylase OafA/YrhL
LAAHHALFFVPYLLCGAGHQAVVIFFVLSGYLISGSIFRMVERNTWNWKLYLTHRLVRLWIVLVPALLLGAALDLSGIRLNLAPALYAGMTGTHMLGNIPASLNLKTFAGNLFFLQGILTPTLGSNTPMWSLANEFWYYLLFPCAFFGLRKGSPVASRVVCAIVFVAAFWFVGLSIRVMFPIWLLGTLLAVVAAPRIRPALIPAAGIVYGFVLFFLAKGGRISGVASDYILGVATFLFLWMLLSKKVAAPDRAWVRASRTGALFLHPVPGPRAVRGAGFRGDGQGGALAADPVHLAIAFLVLIAVITYAYLVACVTEFRTDGVRKWVESLAFGKTMGLRRSSSAAP